MPAESHHEPPLVLGLDVGGTTSRALVADLSGRVLGSGRAGGGNPNAHPPERAVEQVARAARTALSGIDPARVRSGVLGMAGTSKLSDPAVAGRFDQAWNALGLDCPVRVVSDCEVAFAAGTAAPEGSVLVAGTGAVAGRITGHRLTATSGGYGWLLGDEGSGFWLGREAVRAALRSLERGDGTTGVLVDAVFRRLLPSVSVRVEAAELVRKRLIAAVGDTAPIRLSELAVLVTDSARAGDDTAADIVLRAGSLLADTVEATRAPGETTPIVLAGGLLTGDSPVGSAVREELAAHRPVEPLRAGPGEAGAAWLAALDLGPSSVDPVELHDLYLDA